MRSVIRNLAMVFLGSLLGAATVLGYAEHRVAADPVVPAAQAASPESRSNASEELTIEIYQRLSPTVVNIANRRTSSNGGAGDQFAERGVGSGMIIDDQGHILTNNHVIDGADQLEVTLIDGTRVPGKLVGRDPGNDLALLKIEISESLRPRIAVAPLGDSDTVRPGQMAVAIGNPFGFQGSITSGIISSVGRSYPTDNGRSIRNMIQTDAAVNPGNSGGPLINSAGEIIGINTAIESPIRGFVGVGLAVPVNTAKRYLPDMLAGKTVAHPWLGVSGVTITQETAQSLGLDLAAGVYVVHVLPDSPAQEAGIRGAVGTRGAATSGAETELPRGGDVVISVDGHSLVSTRDLTDLLESKRVGDTVTITLFREGRLLEVQAVLNAWPDE